MEELTDFPFTGERRSFDWHLSEPPAEIVPSHYLSSQLEVEAYADLKLCLYLYMMHRRNMYINYMSGAKNLFAIFFPSDHPLKEKTVAWNEGITNCLVMRETKHSTDWPPAYEIQRLWIATKIHWSWLELAWYECECKLFDEGQPWMLEKLERVL
jgi:hypothetical protein